MQHALSLSLSLLLFYTPVFSLLPPACTLIHRHTFSILCSYFFSQTPSLSVSQFRHLPYSQISCFTSFYLQRDPRKSLQKPTPNMHRWDRHKEERVKHKQTHYGFDSQTPAFSSTFLDQINESLKTHHPKTEHQSDELMLPRNRGRIFEEEKMPTLRTAFSSEKRTEKKVQDKVIARRRNPSFSTPSSPSTNRLDELDLQDTLFFSTSRTEYPVFHPPKSALPPRPKLDIDNHDKEAIFVKTRSRAQKIYSNLKYLKQPISPGARLTSLISSLFVKEGKTKKTSTDAVNPTVGGGRGRRECKSEQAPTTPSTRSCLSRSSSKKKKFEDGVKRTVRFCPVGVIVGEDSRPCGHKSLFGDDDDYYYDFEEEEKKKLERENERAKLQQAKQRQLEEMALDLLNGYWDSKLSSKPHNQKVNDKINHVDHGVNHSKNYNHDDDGDGDDDDGVSCSSSDLFELDHLSSFGDELPVYETTHFDSKIM